MKKKKIIQKPAFPLEAIFPGIHARRPDIAAMEAELFLAYGHKCDGFDLDDPEVRAQFVDCPPEKFDWFQVKPTTELQARIDQLPENWERRKARGPIAAADQIAADAAAYYRLPAHLMCAILNGRLLYVTEKA